MKTIFLLFGMGMLLTDTVRAEVALGEVVGQAWTIGTAIAGETTITPAYAVNSYFYHYAVTNTPTGLRDCSVTYKVDRDLFGNYFYSTVSSMAGSKPFSTNKPFPVNRLNKMNMTCRTPWIDGSGKTNYYVTKYFETQTEVVWM